jgi:peptidoglycan/LPS O-acetylase OafA/YrhL
MAGGAEAGEGAPVDAPDAAAFDRAPEAAGLDRAFRPDVEGLRAIAVGLVVIFHAGVAGFGGGYIGVDVFFVISGFVITKLLLSRVATTGRPIFSEFYGRRSRRILPATGLVVIVTVFATYKWLGFIRGDQVADDARWVAVFLGNFHFASVGTNYLSSQLPPSPLQNFWSLGVEEQFYVVYPAAIALICLIGRRISLQTRLLVFTALVFLGSYAWSIHDTAANGAAAYFGTLTHAWELAIGGFVAAGPALWSRIPPVVAAVLGWVGLVLVFVAATTFSTTTQYPGWIAIVPVGGAALIIVGGVAARVGGPELLLGTRPMRWVGKLSFSIYLWHWPILTIAEQDATTPLSVWARLGLVAASVGAAAATYYLLENPVRRSKLLARHRAWSILIGLAIIGVVLLVSTYKIHTN